MGITSWPDQTKSERRFFDESQFWSQSQFGEQLVVQRTPVVELNSSYGTSALRDLVVTANGGSKDDVNGSLTTGEISLSTGTSVNGSADLRSAEVGRYVPGFGAESGTGVRIPTLPTSTAYARWGLISPDGNDGYYFGVDATGVFIAILRGGSETTKVYQSSWNIDTLDGTGDAGNPSGNTLTLSEGVIAQIDFTWYGYGQIVWGFILVDDDSKRQYFIRCHSESVFNGTSIQSPNLQTYAYVDNGASSTTDFTMFVGGRQYAIVGLYNPKYRFTGERRTSITAGTTIIPAISFRRKSAFSDRSIRLQKFNLVNTGNNTVFAEIRLGATLTGASFGTPSNYSAAETALESDISATAVSGGEVVWAGTLVAPGVGATAALNTQDVELDIPNGETITLCVGTFASTSTVFTGFIMREEW